MKVVVLVLPEGVSDKTIRDGIIALQTKTNCGVRANIYSEEDAKPLRLGPSFEKSRKKSEATIAVEALINTCNGTVTTETIRDVIMNDGNINKELLVLLLSSEGRNALKHKCLDWVPEFLEKLSESIKLLYGKNI